MIICPNCKEEIDDDSHYCDQCGQALLYCDKCGRVGMGRRCTHCGGMMVSLEEYQRKVGSNTAYSVSFSSSAVSVGDIASFIGNNIALILLLHVAQNYTFICLAARGVYICNTYR